MRRLLFAAFLVPALAGRGSGAPPDEAWLRKQVRAVRDSDTAAWRAIPWAGSLLEARAASKAERRPVFLFTLSGNLDTGRC